MIQNNSEAQKKKKNTQKLHIHIMRSDSELYWCSVQNSEADTVIVGNTKANNRVLNHNNTFYFTGILQIPESAQNTGKTERDNNTREPLQRQILSPNQLTQTRWFLPHLYNPASPASPSCRP